MRPMLILSLCLLLGGCMNDSEKQRMGELEARVKALEGAHPQQPYVLWHRIITACPAGAICGFIPPLPEAGEVDRDACIAEIARQAPLSAITQKGAAFALVQTVAGTQEYRCLPVGVDPRLLPHS